MVKAAENFNYLVFCYDNSEEDHSKLRSFKKGETLPKELVERLKVKGPKYWMVGGEDKNGPEPEPKTPTKIILSEKEIVDMNKSEQVAILNKLGIEDIPRLEKDRVALILKTQ